MKSGVLVLAILAITAVVCFLLYLAVKSFMEHQRHKHSAPGVELDGYRALVSELRVEALDRINTEPFANYVLTKINVAEQQIAADLRRKRVSS